MGGFWLSAVRALAKRVLPMDGNVSGVKSARRAATVFAKATVWQSWHAPHVLHFPLAAPSVVASPASTTPAKAVPPVQSAADSKAVAAWPGHSTWAKGVYLPSNLAVALVWLAWLATDSVAFELCDAISTAITSPTQPRKGSRTIMRTRKMRRILVMIGQTKISSTASAQRTCSARCLCTGRASRNLE